MKITQSRSKAIKYGSKGSKSFGVNTQNSKFFRVMSDTLYTDKIGSIIRELASNAIDGQRAQGNLETPFDIFLPCTENPKFCIRDYGTGLSPEEIETVYTRYFESTKDQNEDDIGGFGLGAKTPFAYTDSFIVRSYHHGQVFTYTIAFSGDEPEYELQFVQDTDEPNGLEVYFDVDPEDFDEFSTKAFRTLIWFNHVPNVWTGSEDVNGFFKVASNFTNYRERIANFRKDNCFEDENMIICPNSYSNPFEYRNSQLKSRICVIQGGVLYPVSTSASDTLREFAGKIPSNYSVITKHKIGEISLTPSREQIEESKQTIQNIESKISIIMDKSRDVLRETILNDDNSKFAISATIQSLRQGNSYHKTVESIEDGYLVIAREEDQIAFETFKERFDEELLEYKKRIEDFKKLTPIFEGDKVSAYTKHAGYVKPKKVKDISEMRFSSNGFNKVHIVLRDSGISAQIQAVMKEVNIQNNELVFVLDTYKKTLNDSPFSEKLDYLSSIKDQMVDFLECSEADLSIVYESNIVQKAQSNSNIRVYEKNTYAVFEKPYHSRELVDVSVNSIAGYLDKHVLYAIKDGHGNATITLTNENGEKEAHSFSRSELAEITYFASIMFDVKHDSLLFVNKKELRDIEKYGTGTVVELGQALENAFTNSVKVLDDKIATLTNIVEKVSFVESFKSYKHLMKTFQMIGEANDVKKLDTLIAKHSDTLYSNVSLDSFELTVQHKNFTDTPVRSFAKSPYQKNISGIVRFVYEIVFSNMTFRRMVNLNSKLKKGVQEKIQFLATSNDSDKSLRFTNFVNEEVFKTYPILKMLSNYSRTGTIEKEICEDIEQFISMKISEKKCKKVAA